MTNREKQFLEPDSEANLYPKSIYQKEKKLARTGGIDVTEKWVKVSSNWHLPFSFADLDVYA
jgi:hypothetical protein